MSNSQRRCMILCLSLLVISSSLALANGKKNHHPNKADKTAPTNNRPLVTSLPPKTTIAPPKTDVKQDDLTPKDLKFLASYRDQTILLRKINNMIKNWMSETSNSTHGFGAGLSPQKKMRMLSQGKLVKDKLSEISNECKRFDVDESDLERKFRSKIDSGGAGVTTGKKRIGIEAGLRGMTERQRKLLELRRQILARGQVGLRTVEDRQMLIPNFIPSNG